MQLSALIQVINYLKRTSENPVLLEGYKKLTELVREASGNKQGDFSTKILKEKKQLQNLLLESDPSTLGYAPYILFMKINKNQLFGKAAADYLENLISPENKDYPAIYSDLNKKVKQISILSGNLNQFRPLFEHVLPVEVLQSAGETIKKTSLYIYFEGNISVQSLTDMERYARLCDGILDTFSRLTGEETLMLDIIGLKNGNISLSVASEGKTLNVLIKGVLEMITVLSHILKIREIQIELSRLPVSNDLNDIMQEEIQSLINRRALESAEILTSNHFNDTFYADEMTDDIACSLKQLLSFVEKGGKIEYKPLVPSPEANETNKKLIESFKIANELEKTAKTLNLALLNKQVNR
jgi:hypothetical protein